MAVTTTALVNLLLGPHKVTTTSGKLTIDGLEKLIKGVDGEIQTRLDVIGAGEVPETDPFALYLSMVAAWGATAQALKILFPEVTGPGEQPAYAYWEKKYTNALESLEGGVPPEFLVALSTGQASGYFTLYPDVEPEAVVGTNWLSHNPLFRVDDLDEHPW